MSRTLVNNLEREIDRLRAENARLRNLIKLDRTGLASALNSIRKVVDGYDWIPEGSWASYSYEEHTTETLRAEVRNAFDAIREVAVSALRESGDRADAAFGAALKGDDDANM